MKLLTKEIIKEIPNLYETEDTKTEDKVVYAKLFTPWTTWTWYVIEFDGTDRCFGLVKGLSTEFGYFSLKELASVKGPFGLKVERDKFFTPTEVGDMPSF